ncbi:MAG: zinc ribbon domain-containing protein, partial [Candidatus Tectomicrobia bacterium]|nr:zinc ribbon domain-containing protein [Candidatus Tectomicrobia bacterium]
MQCPHCGCDNREGAKFCNECGALLLLRCPSCGTENRPGAKFCDECGAPLTGQMPALSLTQTDQQPQQDDQTKQGKASLAEPAVSEGERRQLTVLFCDLVSSTSLSAQLDPEELQQVLQAYHDVCTKVIRRFDGYIAQYLGDGLLVYFGYPRAHEDDAQRAVRTGLGIVEAIHHVTGPPFQRAPVTLQVRIGIHTGLVVVSEIGGDDKHEPLALGETPNIAAWLQQFADPNTVVMSAVTSRLVEGLFDCRPLGTQALKGLAQPLDVSQVLH